MNIYAYTHHIIHFIKYTHVYLISKLKLDAHALKKALLFILCKILCLFLDFQLK